MAWDLCQENKAGNILIKLNLGYFSFNLISKNIIMTDIPVWKLLWLWFNLDIKNCKKLEISFLINVPFYFNFFLFLESKKILCWKIFQQLNEQFVLKEDFQSWKVKDDLALVAFSYWTIGLNKCTRKKLNYVASLITVFCLIISSLAARILATALVMFTSSRKVLQSVKETFATQFHFLDYD